MSHKHVWNDAWSSDIISMRVKRCVLLHMFLKVRSGLKDSLWLQRFEIISCLSKTVSTSFFSVLSDFKGKPFPFTYFVHTGSKILSEGVTVTSFKLIIFLKKAHPAIAQQFQNLLQNCVILFKNPFTVTFNVVQSWQDKLVTVLTNIKHRSYT